MDLRKAIAAAAICSALIVMGLSGGLNGPPGDSTVATANPPTAETVDLGENDGIGGTNDHYGNPPPATGPGTSTPTDEPLAPPPGQPGPGVLRPAAGTCPGAPPTDGGMQRRPDTAKGPDGRLHMVWSEKLGGQWDVCYASKPGEMGLGSDDNPSWRVTDTPTDSIEPHVSVDSVTGLVYVVWVEEFPDAMSDGLYEVAMDGTSMLYSVTENGTFWSESLSLSMVPGSIKSFEVDRSNGTVKFGDGAQGKRPPSGNGLASSYRFSFDTDSDGIRDADEFLGIMGNVTFWWTGDTDGDGLGDRDEYTFGFSPVVNDLYGRYAKAFLEVLKLYVDGDRDGITYNAEKDCNFPVTTRYANVHDRGSVTYGFWPRSAHDATLTLLLQTRRHSSKDPPPPAPTNYTLAVSVDAGTAGTFSFDHSGNEMEWDRFYVTFGNFSVGEDEQTNITIGVIVEQPPPSDHRTLAIYSVMISGTSGSSEFSYKEGRDYLPGATLTEALTQHYQACGDPVRPDLFLEVDAISGHNPTVEVFSEAINIFSDAGIILHYRIDETAIPLNEATTTDSTGDGATWLNACSDPRELTDFLAAHRTTAPPFNEYVHVIFANRIAYPMGSFCVPVYGIAMSADLASDREHSGVLIADDELDSVLSIATVAQQRTKILAHEVGHAIGASHEKDTGKCNVCVDGSRVVDKNNVFNLMMIGGLDDPSDARVRILGGGNTKRCKGAVEFIGMPRFSIESIDQIDLTNKLSADTGRNIDILGNYV